MNKTFNRNYTYNSKHNSEKIEMIVEEFMAEDLMHAPFDFLFRINSREYPKHTHDLLELPGTFIKKEDTAVFKKNNGALQMDYCESAKIENGTVHSKVAYDVEHQFRELPKPKVDHIHIYCFNTSLILQMPCYPIVATNMDYPSKMRFDVDGFEFTIYFRVFDKEKVYKLLNSVIQKDYSKEELSDCDYLKLIFCLVFAKKEFAKDIVEKIVFFFATIEKISLKLQIDLHLALKIMIKYHFKGNYKKIKEMITMITKAIHETKTEEIPSLENMKTENYKLKNELKQKDNALQQKDNIIQEKDNALQQKDNALQQKDNALQQKDNIIQEKDKKLKELTEILLKNGIII